MSDCNTVEITRSSNKTVVVSGSVSKNTLEIHDPGVAGPANVLAVGTVTTGTAAVTITGTAPSQTLNFVLPIAGQYVYTQSVSASTWTISHNLGFFPSVSVVDNGGNLVIGDVSYITENQVSISFSASFGGKAYFS
jgi:hypothetical protein